MRKLKTTADANTQTKLTKNRSDATNDALRNDLEVNASKQLPRNKLPKKKV